MIECAEFLAIDYNLLQFLVCCIYVIIVLLGANQISHKFPKTRNAEDGFMKAMEDIQHL